MSERAATIESLEAEATILRRERDKLGQALEEVHDYHCGCARPGDLHICVCQPVVVFEVLRAVRYE